MRSNDCKRYKPMKYIMKKERGLVTATIIRVKAKRDYFRRRITSCMSSQTGFFMLGFLSRKAG